MIDNRTVSAIDRRCKSTQRQLVICSPRSATDA